MANLFEVSFLIYLMRNLFFIRIYIYKDVQIITEAGGHHCYFGFKSKLDIIKQHFGGINNVK